jgi:cytoskeletal protein RodZ
MANIEKTFPQVASTEEYPLPTQDNSRSHQRGEVMGEEVASMLKHAREGKGLSLKEAQAGAHVPAHYLQILEGEGDPRLLADVLYLIPFLRTYSIFLGLDPAETVVQFLASVQKGDTLGSPPLPKPARFSSRTLLVILIVVGLIALSFLWISGQHG